MTLTEILAFLNLSSPSQCQLRDIRIDSRQVQLGDLFVALPGKTTDGRNYIGQAVSNGAVAVLLASDDAGRTNCSSTVPIIPVFDLARRLPDLANYYYGYPSDVLKVLGITGTNGKTSCSHYIAQLLQATGHVCGVMGTLGNGFLGDLQPSQLTTNDCCSLQKQLAELVRLKANFAAIEVSSGALDQGRPLGTSFDTAIFTNLSQDHLDYHGNMHDYLAAKIKLFTEYKPKHCVINLDDVAGGLIANLIPKTSKVISYALRNSRADLYMQDEILHTPWGSGELTSPLMGDFNLSNLLACIATCALQGVAIADLLQAAANLVPVAGRMQKVTVEGAPQVIIDYAHTPDALSKVLQTLRAYKPAKLYCIFGCGGDRDRTKRPLMFNAALSFSDQVIITQDNSRTEDPQQIVRDMLQDRIIAAEAPAQFEIELDRATAIKQTIARATAQDMILIAGKGHEDYQIIGTQKYPFSDLLVAQQALNKG